MHSFSEHLANFSISSLVPLDGGQVLVKVISVWASMVAQLVKNLPAMQEPRRDSGGQRSPLLPLQTRPDSQGDAISDEYGG